MTRKGPSQEQMDLQSAYSESLNQLSDMADEITALRAEVALLKSQLTDVQVPYEHAQALSERAEAAEAEVERLNAALLEYAEHRGATCHALDFSTPERRRLPCTCGLADAIRAGTP